VARGLTQVELALRVDISQAALSKLESGLDPFRAQLLADQLDVRPSYFSADNAAPARVFHRKQASLPIGADRRIRAEASLVHTQLTSLLADQLPPLRIARMALPEDGEYDAADIAREVRRQMSLGEGPIEDLVGAIEAAGVIVEPADLRSLRVDAIAAWPDGGVPLIVLNDRAPGDRQRFTLAHEVGHAVMHDLPSESQEAEADEFAAEFLMPASSIREELQDLTPASLARLKSRWKVSMAALARRARDLGTMSDSAYRKFNIQMSASGMNRNEPVEVRTEHPHLLQQIVTGMIADGTPVGTLTDRSMMSDSEFRHRFLEVTA
jgi:Zn-dependent peptidase ImmA (M78 family)